MLTAYQQKVRADATALIVLTGPANRAVSWRLSGSGTLTAIHTRTDSRGVAAARYTPGAPGETVTVEAEYGV